MERCPPWSRAFTVFSSILRLPLTPVQVARVHSSSLVGRGESRLAGPDPHPNGLTRRMRHRSRSSWVFVLLAAAGMFAVAALDIPQSFAEEPQDDPAAQNALETGISAYQDGALEVSIETLSNALEGSLSRQQTAEAHYYRGLAYRELGKPGQAISDLTAAISSKSGLSKAHLKDAMKNRSGAYREAGITPTEAVVVTESSRIPVSIPAGRLPVPIAVEQNQPRQPDPPATSSIGPDSGSAPAANKGDFVSAIEKLIPDWP